MLTKLLPLILILSCTYLLCNTNLKENNICCKPKAGKGAVKEKSIADSPLQQSSWYATAVKNISASEYYFKAENSEDFGTPNRRNNLRFHYNKKGFTAEPRATRLQNNDTSTGNITKKQPDVPYWKVTFTIGKNQLGDKGKWNVVANKAEYTAGNITVQYINTEEGMRQNFIVAAPLHDSTELDIHFSVKTSLKTVLQNNQLSFFHRRTGNVLNYRDLKVWDANGKVLAANFERHRKDYSIHVNTANAVYPITIDPVSSTPAALLESNQAAAAMGCAVASAGDVNGDGYSDILVGAYLYDNGETDEGRVFLYHSSSAGISTTAAASFESNQANSKFGYSVSTAGDINNDGYSDIIIGAYFFDNNQTDEGAAFVYRGSATGVNPTLFTLLESNQASAQFGISVACAGDVNGDGFSDVIVGANGYDNGQSNEGAAFIFHGGATGISSTAATVLESNKAGSFMGVSVASGGDVNGDGYSDVIAGAAAYSNGVGQTGEGAAYIFNGAAAGVNSTPTATLESNQANAGMGQSVSTAGDVNGDGYSDIIIGAFNYDKGQTDEGAAFIYHGSATGIALVASDTLESNQASAKAGRSVACAGDINGDGYSDVLVGIFLFDNGETDEGAVFVYHGSATGINNIATDTLQGNQADAQMGIAVGPAGDINGDGYSDIIAGAWNYDNGETDEGMAFVYNGGTESISQNPVVIIQSNQANAQLGYSIAAAGDVNGDGFGDVIAGANLYDNGEADEGAAFIYYGTINGINTTPAAILESNQVNAQMGNAVSSAGDVNGDGYDDVIVGAHLYNNGQNDEGVAFIYYGAAAGINTAVRTLLENNQNFSEMGFSVAAAGDVNSDGFADVIVGALLSENGQSQEGRALIFHGAATGTNTVAAAVLESNQAVSFFGYSVAGAGDINGDGFGDVIVGASNFDDGQTDEGAAFVYYGSQSGINTTAAAQLECNQADARMGTSVAGVGDVNGDGYSDVAAGAITYDHGQSNEGAVFIYYGSASGINANPSAITEGNIANANIGQSLSSAGDVNGDGYSDIVSCGFTVVHIFTGSPSGIDSAKVIVLKNTAATPVGYVAAGVGDVNGDGYSDVMSGYYYYTSGETFEGGIFMYYGNTGNGKRNNMRLYNADLLTPLKQSNTTSLFFGAGLYAKSSLGRQKAKLVWETKRDGIPFSGSPITNSTVTTSQAASYTDLGLTGIELKQQADKMLPTKATYIRTRVKYNPATAITGQVYGPWHYPDYFLRGTRNFNLSLITYIWTGVVSTAWETPGNWSSFVVPGATADVLIPPLRPRYPIISVSTSINSLTVSQGASTTAAPGITVNILGH